VPGAHLILENANPAATISASSRKSASTIATESPLLARERARKCCNTSRHQRFGFHADQAVAFSMA
jgi:hypothetical protein